MKRKRGATRCATEQQTAAEQAEIIKTLTEKNGHLESVNWSLRGLVAATESCSEASEATIKQLKGKLARSEAALVAQATAARERETDAMLDAEFEQERLQSELWGLRRGLEQTRGGREQKVSNGECIMCTNAPVRVVLVPCGHAMMCQACSDKTVAGPCPICRAAIEKRIPLYMP